MTSKTTETRSGGVGMAAVAAVLILCAFQIWSALDSRDRMSELSTVLETTNTRLAEMEDLAARMETATVKVRDMADRIEALDVRTKPLTVVGDEWPFIVDDIQRVDTKVSKLVTAFEHHFDTEIENPAVQPPELDWTEPALFEAAGRAAESVGITLTKDEVRVPSRVLLRGGMLEYFAVLKGGKEHESLISLVGNTPEDDRRPRDFAAKLNNAVQALGFKRGKPIRFSAGGTRPPEGEPVFLFIEWEEDGKTVVVRAEDLIWNRVTGAPMARGSWVYVGSSFVPGDNPGESLFAADLTGEVVSTYSAVNTMIDNTSKGAADDTVFVVAGPRIPEDVSIVDLLIRRKDREATRTFPDDDEDPGIEQVRQGSGGDEDGETEDADSAEDED